MAGQVGRPPSCLCGSCSKCRARIRARIRYQNMSLEDRRAIVAARDPEKVRESDRARYQRDKPKRRALNDAYAKTEPGRSAHSKATALDQQLRPERRKARNAVSNALRDGRLVRGECARSCEGECSGRVQAHHEDYAHPLDVTWLCVAHHTAEHRSLRDRRDPHPGTFAYWKARV